MNRVMVVTDNLNQAKNLDFVITVQSWQNEEKKLGFASRLLQYFL